MRAVRVRSRHFNGRQPSGVGKYINISTAGCVFLGGGAYARDKNTSVRVCAKNAGGGLCARGGIFAGHYGITITIFMLFSTQDLFIM